jgi:hypothetical protein
VSSKTGLHAFEKLKTCHSENYNHGCLLIQTLAQSLDYDIPAVTSYTHKNLIKIRKFQSNTTSLLYVIDWLHVLTLWGYHQAFTMNHFVKKNCVHPWDPKQCLQMLTTCFCYHNIYIVVTS